MPRIFNNPLAHTSPSPSAKPLRAKGAGVLFLPPCSPDLNPIKTDFFEEVLLKKAATRSVHALRDTTIRDAIDAATSQDNRSFFTACGYQPQ
ncbi:MAG: hypothetical protein OXC54_05870 [Rhodospirillaceae bacterium]|nr:hypothetical protein [Rhodospirillaceae bacterium]